MLDRQKYSEYLLKKTKNAKVIDDNLRLFGVLEETISKSGVKAPADVNEKIVADFIDCLGWSMVERQKGFDFIDGFASFIRSGQTELNPIADAISAFSMRWFEDSGKTAASSRRKTIVPIPADAVIDSRCLAGLTNAQFVDAFSELQKLVCAMYDDIGKDPFGWGYPDFYTTEGYYNILIDFLFGFVTAGNCADGVITVKGKDFRSLTSVKRHKKHETVIAGLNKMGFDISGFDKKATVFTVAYPTNPHVVTVLNSYVSNLDETSASWSMGTPRYSLSHRFIEDAATQKYETVFHAAMDLSSERLRQMQYWLHGEAEKYGFKIDNARPLDKNCICYQKGSKQFLLVGEREYDGADGIYSKVIFRDVFEKERDKMAELSRRFPDTLKSNCRMCSSECVMRITYDIEGEIRRNCAYNSFFFDGLTLDDVKDLAALHIAENKIK